MVTHYYKRCGLKLRIMLQFISSVISWMATLTSDLGNVLLFKTSDYSSILIAFPCRTFGLSLCSYNTVQ